MRGITRRFVLKGLAATGITAALGRFAPVFGQGSAPEIVVVGAGALGGWTALQLLRLGAKVTLLDAWGPGNSRSSSGGESRIMRRIYGPDRVYTEMASRALDLWQASERHWNRRLFHRTGALWMVVNVEDYALEALTIFDRLELPYEKLTVADAARRFPRIRFDGVKWVIREPEAGYLLAREGCRAVWEAFIEEGGTYREAEVRPGPVRAGRMDHVQTGDGAIRADHYVFACGPWLGGLFPEIREDLVVSTRQEVFYFGTPAGDAGYDEGHMPVWINHDAHDLWYGIPGNEHRGFKVANSAAGPRFDPTGGDRMPSGGGERAARAFLARRFPALAEAPLVEARVCQYETSPDTHFIIDNHPAAENCWLVGGGSGHAYKMGPAVGELAAKRILGAGDTGTRFFLNRFRGID